jgi:hypothetical protein
VRTSAESKDPGALFDLAAKFAGVGFAAFEFKTRTRGQKMAVVKTVFRRCLPYLISSCVGLIGGCAGDEFVKYPGLK